MAHDMCRLDSQSPEKRRHVLHEVEHAVLGEIAVVAAIPAGSLAVAALVRCDDMEARVGKRLHDLAPAIGELGKAVQQEHSRPAIADLAHMHAQAVYAFDEARADQGRRYAYPSRCCRRVISATPEGTKLAS